MANPPGVVYPLVVDLTAAKGTAAVTGARTAAMGAWRAVHGARASAFRLGKRLEGFGGRTEARTRVPDQLSWSDRRCPPKKSSCLAAQPALVVVA